ncbi:hypothetical protein [Tumebacillus permanentifrigoris]|uniref:Uncharacterized protein n=1 Tax=Tumebacillus permanentifrigoris TaxID=378543 RepID=A0A316D4F3_9BACL|nr:hypothetical protein [Tumebacillus permanentifrigoris]PWK07424.1 hypothetical protein C7459_11722 [Tumebacillus permanentifrigoris]
MNPYPHRTEWCPRCNQGWVEIRKEVERGTLFVRCSECLVQWHHPAEAKDLEAGFRNHYQEAVEPTSDEIRAKQWELYLVEPQG